MDEKFKIYFMNLEISNLQKKFGRNLIINESLSKYSWFNLGGPAELFFRPDSKEQLVEFLKFIHKKKKLPFILSARDLTLSSETQG